MTTIKSKLYASAGISIILVVLLFSVILVTTATIDKASDRHQALMQFQTGVSELDILSYQYLLYGEKRVKEQWYLKYQSLAESLEESPEEETFKLVHADYVKFGDIFSEIATNDERMRTLLQEGTSKKEIDLATELGERLATQLLLTSHSVITDASRLAEQAHVTENENRSLATNVTLIVGAFLVATVVTSSLIVARSISKPLNELTKGVEVVGKGDLNHKIGLRARDELGQLANAFDRMTDSLKEVTASRDELDREVAVRKRTEGELARANSGLSVVNRELEAFSYSVSHDLRAPLRSIDGFSQALMEDYPDTLDEQGKDYLQRVRSAAQRMGILIEDMLNLSRLTRREMRRETVDLSTLAQLISTQLQESQTDRRVEFVVAPGLTASGDAHLLEILLENLLGNAWKFTGHHDQARIEFGRTQIDGEHAYFVRDDGAGFDMAYSDKLFGAFQRLHTEDEFEGTGIGLATVQRIARRHGGRAWAEGKVGKGATFYFTLQTG